MRRMCILWRKPALKLDKFKQKAADNLLNAIEASKGANLDRSFHLWAGHPQYRCQGGPQPFERYHGR